MADVSPPGGEPPTSDPTPGATPPPQIGAGGVPLPPGYELVARLGSGGFATVWLAEQGRLGRRVAVKILGESLSDSERERRFVAECRAIGSLSGHPAVVTVHDAGTTSEGHPYLVMEHLPGGSLHDRVATTGPLPWEEVVSIGVAVGDALAAAHDAGILHRDVKPANVLVADDGSPKLGDFGIARLAEGTNTATGTLVGTIPFTPPEVLSGHRPGPTADIWALGATLYALVERPEPLRRRPRRAPGRDHRPGAPVRGAAAAAERARRRRRGRRRHAEGRPRGSAADRDRGRVPAAAGPARPRPARHPGPGHRRLAGDPCHTSTAGGRRGRRRGRPRGLRRPGERSVRRAHGGRVARHPTAPGRDTDPGAGTAASPDEPGHPAATAAGRHHRARRRGRAHPDAAAHPAAGRPRRPRPGRSRHADPRRL